MNNTHYRHAEPAGKTSTTERGKGQEIDEENSAAVVGVERPGAGMHPKRGISRRNRKQAIAGQPSPGSHANWGPHTDVDNCSLFQIGILMGAYSLTIVLLEVPTGGLADAVGRKRVTQLAYAIGLSSGLVLIFAFSFQFS